MMTPGQASALGKVLEVETPTGRWRAAAHVFDLVDGGIAWIDLGWTDPLFSGHACHILRGSVNALDDYGEWLLVGEYDAVIKPTEDRPDGDRELARQMIEADLGISLPKK